MRHGGEPVEKIVFVGVELVKCLSYFRVELLRRVFSKISGHSLVCCFKDAAEDAIGTTAAAPIAAGTWAPLRSIRRAGAVSYALSGWLVCATAWYS
jgi:hypothetical protein